MPRVKDLFGLRVLEETVKSEEAGGEEDSDHELRWRLGVGWR